MAATPTPTAPGRAVEALARRPLLLIVAGTVLFSTGPVMVAGAAASGPVLSFWRLWIGAVVLGGATLVTVHRSGRRPDRTGWVLAVRAGTAFGFHQLLFMSALKRTSVIDVLLMQLLAPIIVGVLAVVLFAERPGAAFRLWSLVSVAGAAVVVLAGSAGPQGDPLGAALAVGNVVFYALYFVGSKQARSHIDTTPFLFAAVVTAGVVVSAWVLVAGEPVAAVATGDLLVAAAVAVVPGALGHFVTTWQLHRVPANLPPLVHLAMPFLSGALAWLLLDQGVGAPQVAGGALTLVGVVGALRSRSAPEVPGVPAD